MVNYYENITNDRVNMANLGTRHPNSEELNMLKEGKTAKRKKNYIIFYENLYFTM